MVYSTNPAAMNDWSEALLKLQSETSGDEGVSAVRVGLEKKGRGGKWVSIVRGLSTRELDEHEKALKSHCAVGGSVKEGELILQGDVREKAISYLKKQGIQAKKAGA